MACNYGSGAYGSGTYGCLLVGEEPEVPRGGRLVRDWEVVETRRDRELRLARERRVREDEELVLIASAL